MYIEFYGLKELPFALTPDPRYIYFTPSHTEVMANLHYGIESGKGLIVVTGEVGTGKTTMLRWVMQRLDRTVMVAYIFNPRLSVTEFYQHLATLFGIQNWETKSDLLIELGKVLDSRHSRGLRTVLIVDEAHGLSPTVLEEIRLLCNYESDTAKQLQIVLTGQPELREILKMLDAVDKALKPTPLPDAVTAERAKKRITDLIAAKPEEPLPVLVEARFYMVKGLLPQNEFIEAAKALLGEEGFTKLSARAQEGAQ